MSSNAYAEKIAPKAEGLLPESIALEVLSHLPGQVIWRHQGGAMGLIDLSHVNRSAVDNRRLPTDDDVARLVELVTNDARAQASDPRYTDEARTEAQSAWADFT